VDANIALEAMPYIRQISPILMLIGAISFADLTISFLVKLMKKGRIKW
jgi:hypothetical protein